MGVVGLRNEGSGGDGDDVDHVHQRWGRISNALCDGKIRHFSVICGEELQDLYYREVRVHVGKGPEGTTDSMLLVWEQWRGDVHRVPEDRFQQFQ